jgi:hypothetical protein
VDALEPGDRVFMVSMHDPPERRIPLHRGFIDGAARRGVARIVYLVRSRRKDHRPGR